MKDQLLRFVDEGRIARWAVVITLAITVLLTAVQFHKKRSDQYTPVNNYIIFKSSFHFLLTGEDLYALHPETHFDYYKYSPSFPLFMAPFYALPDLPGVLLWNILNSLLLVTGLLRLRFTDKRKEALALLFVLLETATSLQNSQSNGLIAGLAVWSLVFQRDGKILPGTLLAALSVSIKVYGGLTILLFLFDRRWLKSLLAFGAWCMLIAALPLLVVSPAQLQFLYESWGRLLSADHDASTGISLMGLLAPWLKFSSLKAVVTLLGLAALADYLWRSLFAKQVDRNLRSLLILGHVLIWLVILNHKAESPTFVIAVTGAMLLYAGGPKDPNWRWMLPLLLILTCLSPTDLFPKFIRDTWVVPYSLKALPCVVIYCYSFVQLHRLKKAAA
ncbi:MAG: glycosyltransferase family 87 protein [Bacteroidota bacterium]|jgi:hypothetical protein|uniref:glycosyltransferase family 87 protein n=1 Tax=Candidatus Pollutiaquabacter sp. TaxID=3416354 RepID=UPI001A44A85E|nr:DUF2029 domain-containing protein [Bacteroidota bacterium]MBL7949050.1 DUF2029 domain-containing protein [Bacteroidia bacterium]MBP7269004.1 DUF2029 domain-containing protein [Bacteroidia bacterium]MBP7436446.1 DUF2029 domain-containing protein [Bacteroidia bacterium]MBP7728233.1 DUF2029 domain-containing protein [Bacteroidia bacterium]